MRIVGAAAAAAMSLLLLTGCGSLAAQPTRTPTVTVAPTSTTPTPTPTPSATPTVTANPEPSTTPVATDPNRPANQCPDGDIGVAVGPNPDGGAAGSTSSTIYFTNTGGAACVLRGTPGVSVIGSSDAQLGKPADRIQTGVTTVTLASGATAQATLKIVNIGTDGGPLDGCTVQQGTGYRVYPPHSKKAFIVEDPKAVACSPGPVFMTVGPVQEQTD